MGSACWMIAQHEAAGFRTRQVKHAIIARRGKQATNFAEVDAARELLSLVFYGLRDGHIRALSAPPRAACLLTTIRLNLVTCEVMPFEPMGHVTFCPAADKPWNDSSVPAAVSSRSSRPAQTGLAARPGRPGGLGRLRQRFVAGS
jgi:hypothetical protein